MKSVSFNVFIIFLIITAITLGLLFITYGAKDTPYNYGPEHFSNSNALEYLHDYQLEYHMDTIWVFDFGRLVGTHIDTNYQHGQFIDSLIMADNL